MSERLEGLDTFKALTATLILIYHLSFYTNFLEYIDTISNWAAVESFFVLSGFSLYLGYFNRLNNPEQVKAYYIRRFLRIAPLFYIMIVVWAIRMVWANQGTGYSFITYLLNFTFLFNFFPGLEESIVQAGWAIGVLFLFYLIVPVLLVFIRRIRYALLLLVGFLFISYFYSIILDGIPGLPSLYSKMSIITQFPFFIIGLLCFLLIRGILVKKELLQTRLIKGVGLGLMVFAMVLACMLMWVFELYYLWGLVFVCLMIGLIFYPSKVLVNRPLTFIGVRSYSIYLLHPFVILLSSPIYNGISSWISNIPLAFFLSFIYTYALVLSFSILTYRFIEQPFGQLEFSKLFKNK